MEFVQQVEWKPKQDEYQCQVIPATRWTQVSKSTLARFPVVNTKAVLHTRTLADQ
jgi:hypothetical protein